MHWYMIILAYMLQKSGSTQSLSLSLSLYIYIYMYVQRETCVYTMLTTSELVQVCCMNGINVMARLAQSAERKALNLVVVGSSPTVGAY